MANRTVWVRVKDRETRHEFDIPEGDPRIGALFDPVKHVGSSPVVRPPKHHTKLAALNAPRPKPEPTGDGKPATKEA